MRRTRWTLSTALALVGACASPTAPEPLAISVTPVQHVTAEAYASWPMEARIEGGSAVVVRGTALVGCGTVAGSAGRRGREIEVDVFSVGDHSPCPLSRWAWQPFVATIEGLGAGEYTVYASVVGHDDTRRTTVRIVQGR